MFAGEFSHLPIFNGFSAEELEILDSLMSLEKYYPNQVIFNQGEKTDFLYILNEGEIVIDYKPYDGSSIQVAVLHPGSVFGWSAIIGREEYTSQAKCTKAGLTYRISSQNVTLLCSKYPEVGEKFIARLMSSIDERIKQSHSQMRDSLSQGMRIIDMYIGSKVKNG